MSTQNEFEPFATIILQGLAERTTTGAMTRCPEHNAPRYVVQMCEALTRAIGDAGNPGVTLAEVVRLEHTCTGADYHQKFALRCQRLAFSAAA